MESVFEARAWTGVDAAAWGGRPTVLRHRLHESPLFSLETLAGLIEIYPKARHSLVHTGARGDRRSWREGEIGDLTGREVIDAIAAGRMWLNLRDVNLVDDRYRDLQRAIFAEIARNVPGFATFDERIGILVSSPNAQVYYHADLPGQGLWQIHGRKRIYIYPPEAPFLMAEQLENAALYGFEQSLAYSPDYDRHATVVELQPGQMAHWPLNSPHRVDNHDCLNVSMTLEYWSDDIRRRHQVNIANGLLRNYLGVNPGSRAISGPAFLGKAVLQAAARRSGWLGRVRAKRRPVEFRLDRQQPPGPAGGGSGERVAHEVLGHVAAAPGVDVAAPAGPAQ